MAELSKEQVTGHIDDLKAIFADGFQVEDIGRLVKEVTEIAETYKGLSGMSGAERKEAAVAIINQFIDDTNTPWLPDPLTDPIFKRVAPGIIDAVLDAANGKFKLSSFTGDE